MALTEPVHLFIQSAESGVMDVLLVVPDGEDLMTLRLAAHVALAGDRRYVNLRHKILVASKPDEEEPEGEHAEWRAADRYIFARYGAESVITDEPEWILRFLEIHDDGENFEGPATFRRITGS